MQRFTHPSDHLLLLASEGDLRPWRLVRVQGHLRRCAVCRVRQLTLQGALDLVESTSPDIAVSATADMSAARLRLVDAMHRERHAARPEAGWAAAIARSVVHATPPMAAAVALAVGILLALNWTRPAAFETSAALQVVMPLAALTPGAASSLTADALCAGERPSRVVTTTVRDEVLSDYGMQGVAADNFELDALITPELGGTATRANIWPQRYTATWNAHVKDALESLLATRVCSGQLPLATAQRALAVDWIAAYRQYFDTAMPLPAHVAAVETDDDLIVAALPVATAPLAWTGARWPRVGFVRVGGDGVQRLAAVRRDRSGVNAL